MKRITTLLALILISTTSLAEIRIAVLGATDDMGLMQRWSMAMGVSVSETAQSWSFRSDDANLFVLAPKPDTPLALVANTVYTADAAVIVMDTTQGPLPVNREHIIVSRQAGVPVVAILMANVDKLYALAPEDAVELLQLEEAEIRDVLALYEVGGADSILLHDSTSQSRAPRSAAGTLRDSGRVFARVGSSKDQQSYLGRQMGAQGQVYLLTDAEAGGQGVSISRTASLQIWSEGSTAMAEFSTEMPVGPGDVASVVIRATEPIAGGAGSRILLLERDRVVGLGVLTEVSSF